MTNRWFRGVGGLTVTLALLLVATGCGTPQNNTTQNGAPPSGNGQGGGNGVDSAGNPPFQNLLKDEVAPLDTKYDPAAASKAIFTDIRVVNSQGKVVTLDAAKQPILLVAYWCPHCQRTLVMLSKNIQHLSQVPVLVSMGFQPKTTLAEAKTLTSEEHRALNLSHQFQIDYGLNVNVNKLIPVGFPTLVYDSGGKLEMLYGEHTLKVWQEALTAAK